MDAYCLIYAKLFIHLLRILKMLFYISNKNIVLTSQRKYFVFFKYIVNFGCEETMIYYKMKM